MTTLSLRNDPFFADFLRLTRPPARSGLWQPYASLSEDEQGLKLTVEVPGVNREQLEVTFDEGILTVRGEGHRGRFERFARLGHEVDEAAITASLENGLLTVSVPRRVKEDTLRRIEVQ